MDILSFLLGVLTLFVIFLIAVAIVGFRYEDKELKQENLQLKRELREHKKK